MAKNKQQDGFTLIEAVVTTAVIAVMSAMVITGTNGAREKFQVRNAAQQFASDLRETILLTKNGINAGGCTGDTANNRGCSSYTIYMPSGGDTYDRKVVAVDLNSSTPVLTEYGKVTFSLLGRTKFLTASGNSLGFFFSFPYVAVIGTPEIVVASKNNEDIKMYVCVTDDGAVSVKNDPC